MASSLVTQLAQIRAQGANPLDLKAQKKAHSQSLLFNAQVAATQDFDTIFWICNEGFQDLCRLDSRFADFSQSIFSEQSKQADRTQMTALQISQLDKNLEMFLGMVCGRLLLKPALKAVEWLVRRFRIHENNTVYLVLTFLPYHTSSIFTTLLSILPKSLPPTLRFLHPYIQSLASPPRHAIVYTASHNPNFSSIFNSHILELCRLGYQFPAICSFWATVTTESVAAMLDQSRSGIHAVRKENREGLILRILPILNEGLAMKNAPDLQIGCFMVLTLLAAKTPLSDNVLNAAMEAVVSNWSQTTAPGLICLATLAEQREVATLPRKVFKALLALEHLYEDLVLLKTQYRVDSIALGVLLGVLAGLEKTRNSHHVGLVRSFLESNLMKSSHLTAAIAAICAEVQKPEKSSDAKEFFTNLLYSLAESKNLKPLIKTSADENGPDLPRLTESSQTFLPADDEVDEDQEDLAVTSAVRMNVELTQIQDSPDIMIDKTLEPTFRAAPLSTSALQATLDSCLELFRNFQNDSNAPKRRRTTHRSITSATSHDAETLLKQLTTTLELVETSKPGKHPGLMKGLFQILTELQNSRSHFGTDMAYLQVVTLENIHSIVKEAEKSSVSKLDKSAVRADIIVESIRTTTSAQVQHVAFLLISSLASICPESVLHSVMPVFTFMGAGILRQNDDYSIYVVSRTMESVIPRLVVSLRKQKKDPMIGVSNLILGFVAAFEHIPSQRRLDLFKSLADKIGAPDCLFALLIILIDKHSSDRKILDFAAELAGLYDIETQFRTVEKYLSVISDMLRPKPTISQILLSVSRSSSAVAVANLLPLIPIMLKKKRFISKTRELLDRDAESEAPIRVLYERVMEMVFVLSSDLRHDKTLDAICQQSLDSLLGLPPISDFIRIIQRLLIHAKIEVRLHVLKSFQQRLSGNSMDQDAAQKSSLAVLPQLSSILEESDHLPLKHAALTSVNLVVRRFGKQDLPAALGAAKIVSEMEILGADDQVLRISALLCLATVVEVLKDMFTPLVPRVFPKALDYLSESFQEETVDHRLHNAAYTFIGALLSNTPWILTDSYLELLVSASCRSASSRLGKECDDIRSDTLRHLARQVDPELCITALDRTWEIAMSKGSIVLQATKEHLEVLRVVIEQRPKSSIVKHSDILSKILIKHFDLRRVQLLSTDMEPSFTANEIEEIEQLIFEIAIAMIYKLSDATFRPIFRKILAWSNHLGSGENAKKANLYRQTTLYSFLAMFFGNLKSIVTSYAGLIIEDSAKILQNIQVTEEESRLLEKRVIATLHKAFEHDQDDFWQSPDHFSPIADALIHQFEYASDIPMTADVIPALTELVVAADSTNHHKQLNSAILRFMRSDKVAIRLAAVQCEHSLTDRLGEEWLAHLPEMLPFISELQEDDDEMVEKVTYDWIKKIESVLGESVKPMLQ